MELLTTQNAKTVKGEKRRWHTGIMYLAPGRVAGGPNVCPHADAGCQASCLFTAGRGRMDKIKKARIRKTQALFKDRKSFIASLDTDINRIQAAARRKGMRAAVRLNGTSDLPWHTAAYGKIMCRNPDVMHYDYTKDPKRMRARRPDNYHLTFSRGVNNDRICKTLLKEGHNVAVVFDKVPVGKKFWGYPVIDGDLDDLRFLDKSPCIIGLKAKGKARQDTTGFVVKTAEAIKE